MSNEFRGRGTLSLSIIDFMRDRIDFDTPTFVIFSRRDRFEKTPRIFDLFIAAPMSAENQTILIEGWIARLKTGDAQARKELINCACDRLTRLSRKMLRGFHRVKRWEATDDVVQNALMRLYRTLADVQPATAVEFYRLAATNIRRELLDLAKHYYGPQGLGANYASVVGDAKEQTGVVEVAAATSAEDDGRLEAWAKFHDQVEQLADEDKEVFDLLWYQQLSQAEAAQLLNISERTVKRRWASARLKLHEALGGQSPES